MRKRLELEKVLTFGVATVILHEMMHAAIVTYEANSQRRVHDLAYKVRGSNQRQDIYGAARIKILARSGLGLVGKYSVQNGIAPPSKAYIISWTTLTSV